MYTYIVLFFNKKGVWPMLGFGRLRKKMEARVLRNLSFPQEFYIPKSETSGHIVRPELYHHAWGIFPLYRFTKIREVQWKKEMWESMAPVSSALLQLTETLRMRFVSLLGKQAKKQIIATHESAEEKIAAAYTNFHELFITNLIKKSVDNFRRNLLEKLGANCGKIFASNVHDCLGMLAHKTCEEFAKQSLQESAILRSGECSLPDNTRFLFEHKKTLLFVIEQKPQVRNVFFAETPRSEKKYPSTLAFPFMVFFIAIRKNSFRELRVFFRNSPLENARNELLCPALPNIHEVDFRVCFPSPGTQGNAKEIVSETLQNFWGSVFNSDWNAFLRAAQTSFPQIASLERWQEETKRNPAFITTINWHPAQTTVEKTAHRFLEFVEREAVKDPAKKTDLSPLERYVEKLSGEITQKIQEACFFLVERIAVNDPSKKIAEQELKKTFDGVFADIEKDIAEDIDAIFAPLTDPQFIETPINKAVAAIESDVKRTEEKIHYLLKDIFCGK
ncbi:MAG: hypothetical protein HYZ69_01530 [Candidatus Colwellbacteria bacterium]|nr:hypothetical protein [Candidatus Colwellbacteria bacterium]